MKNLISLILCLMCASLLFSCERKDNKVNPSDSGKTESGVTVVDSSEANSNDSGEEDDLIETGTIDLGEEDDSIEISDVDMGNIIASMTQFFGENSLDEAKSGNTVIIVYTGTEENGEIFGSSYHDITKFDFTVGAGEAISGFDNAVLGMKVGETKIFKLSPEEAYGEYDETNVQIIPKNEAKIYLDYGYNLEVGEELFGMYKIIATTDVDEEGSQNENSEDDDYVPGTITIDMNHPLAGKNLTFWIAINKIESGDVIETGSQVSLTYAGILDDGSLFDSSYNLLTLNLGQDEIPGFDDNIIGMKLGEKKSFSMPSNLIFGGEENGAGSIKFDVEVLSIIAGDSEK